MAIVLIDPNQSVMVTVGQVWNVGPVDMNKFPFLVYDTTAILGVSSPSDSLVRIRIASGYSEWHCESDTIAKQFVALAQSKLGIGA